MNQRTEARKQPVQDRSRTRVDTILSAATALISEVGSDGLKMSAVATRAGVPIGSVYQYFPNKASIIRTLAQESLSRIRQSLIHQFNDITSLEQALEHIEAAIQDYYIFFKNEPIFRDIWCSAQSDIMLQKMDIEDSQANGKILFDVLKAYTPKSNHENLDTMCFLCMQLTGAAVRLAITLDQATGRMMMQQYTTMLQTNIRDLSS